MGKGFIFAAKMALFFVSVIYLEQFRHRGIGGAGRPGASPTIHATYDAMLVPSLGNFAP